MAMKKRNQQMLKILLNALGGFVSQLLLFNSNLWHVQKIAQIISIINSMVSSEWLLIARSEAECSYAIHECY